MTDRPRCARCPICGKPSLDRFRPFCSERCAQRDLGQWLSDGYTIPGSTAEEEERPSPPARSEG
ncbi:MAG TPA: DNA gyrase inhibitor YacG [Acetobacteraceae bacterium]|nr:DNA gyrase inhibitor YacG [Acetobacteraceae bacterium]